MFSAFFFITVIIPVRTVRTVKLGRTRTFKSRRWRPIDTLTSVLTDYQARIGNRLKLKLKFYIYKFRNSSLNTLLKYTKIINIKYINYQSIVNQIRTFIIIFCTSLPSPTSLTLTIKRIFCWNTFCIIFARSPLTVINFFGLQNLIHQQSCNFSYFKKETWTKNFFTFWPVNFYCHVATYVFNLVKVSLKSESPK